MQNKAILNPFGLSNIEMITTLKNGDTKIEYQELGSPAVLILRKNNTFQLKLTANEQIHYKHKSCKWRVKSDHSE